MSDEGRVTRDELPEARSEGAARRASVLQTPRIGIEILGTASARQTPYGAKLVTVALAAFFLVSFARLHAADEIFDFETLRFRAKMLAAKPYVARPSTVPAALRKLSYDDYRLIKFVPAQAHWRNDGLPYQLQFFHPGFVHKRAVQINEVDGRTAVPIKFSRAMFDYSGVKVDGGVPDSAGFAGFRVLGSLGIEDRPWDEIVSFVGASYFRALCAKAVYGLSARGIAINTADAGGEEFPNFEEFWIERPAAGAKQFTIYALLDGPSVAGAYRLRVSPGAETVMLVKAAVYARQNPHVFGIAPLTSMFWHGENSSEATNDLRPEVHDSDGLMINNGAGEWLWRPLTDPKTVRVAAFGDDNPRGFGLVQRDRNFENYQDLETHYHLRPSAWIEPIGAWGRGSVRLVEIPTPGETNDNIVAFWSPDTLPAPGEAVEFEYRLHWYLDQIGPPAGRTVGTRHGRSQTQEPDLERFTVDFGGTYLEKQKPDPLIECDVSVGAGAKLTYQNVQKNTFNGTWRVSFGIRPDGSGHPVELRCFLKKPPHVLTETWTYLWQP